MPFPPLFLAAVIAVIAAAALTAPPVLAHESYLDAIPNGRSVVSLYGHAWPAIGHTSPNGGHSLNPFGRDFALAGREWTRELCLKDSDGDGLSNGKELGDEHCTWTPTTPPSPPTDTIITHPGFREDEEDDEDDEDYLEPEL